MRRPGDSFGHELSEFTDIDQHLLHPRPQDPGATMLILHVANLDDTIAALKNAGGEIVSSEGKPVAVGGKRAIIARDPEGYLLELIESEPAESSVGITVASLENTRRFYEGLLGFKITSPAKYENEDLKLMGLTKGEYRVSSALVPGTSVRFEFYEYRRLTGADAPQPVHYRFQDPGAPQGQFHVRDLDHLLDESKKRGVPFLSKDQKPIERAFGRFVFVIDPDGVFVELVQPKQ
jgi:predicted enzyme related to lactoylglutathione lyase